MSREVQMSERTVQHTREQGRETAETAARPLRLAVIGAGARSEIAGHAVEAGDGVIVAVADPSAAARDRAAEQFGAAAQLFPGHRELIAGAADVDAAFVTSPDHTHAEVAIDLLNAGIAVYLEKPLAIDVDAADAVLAAAADSGTPLYVGHNMRHMAVVQTMRDIIQRGEIGEVKAIWCRHFVGNGGDYYFKDWHAERAKSNGLLLQKGAHDIDVIHWLAGGYSELVTGMGGAHALRRHRRPARTTPIARCPTGSRSTLAAAGPTRSSTR